MKAKLLFGLIFAIIVFIIFSCPTTTVSNSPTITNNTPQVAIPVITPASGTIEQDLSDITMTCSTAGAAIYYTTDGSVPDTGDNLYAGPIHASGFAEGSRTISAVGILSGSTNSIIAQVDYTVTDTLAPIPVISSIYSGAVAADFDITLTFSEPVNGFDQSDITLANAAITNFSDANPVFTMTIHPTVDDTTVTVDINAAVCIDTSLIPLDNVAATGFSIFYDKDSPQGIITSSASSPTRTSPIPISIDFGMNVTNFAVTDITVGNGTLSNFAGGPRAFTADVTPSGQGTITVDIAAGVCNAALTATSNIASPQFTIIYDSVRPTVTINQAAAQNDPCNSTINFSAVFSEPVTGFVSGEVNLSGSAGATTGTVTEIAPNDGTSYNVAVSGMTGNGTVIAYISAAIVYDDAGNENVASTSTDNTVNYDMTAPGVTISSTASDPATTNPVPVSISFTEPVTGFTVSDINVTGGTAGNFQSSDNIQFTFDVSSAGAPVNNSTIIININAGVCEDFTGGNPNTAAASFTAHFNGAAIGLTTNQNISVVFGQADYTSNAANRGGSVGPNTYSASYGEPVYAAGKLFLPDTNNNRVLVFNTVPSANNANADYVIGQPDLISNTAGLSATSINGPESVSSNGEKLMVVDYYNNRILIYNTIPTGSGAAADVVVGQADFDHNGAGRTNSTINGPESAFITSNKLLIADSINNRVLIFNSIPATNGASASLVLGQVDFTSGGAGTTATTLNNPTDVWTDGTRLIVSDAGNNRILIWNTFPTSNAQAADVVVGQTNFTTGSNGTAANKFMRQWNFTASSESNQLIVTDLDNHRVLVFNSIPSSNGASADVVLGQSNFTSRSAGCSQTAINWPCGACIIDNTRIMVIDANNNRAVIFSGM